MELLTPWLVVVGLLYLLRRLERWLHQHIFKVGWLLTKNYQSTTILYYTFFLPGVVLHEFVLWLAAGILNVRADRAIARPQAQEIAELKLNFVRLHKSTGRVKLAIISIAPLVAGIATVWLVTNNVFNVTAALETMRGGYLESVSRAIGQLTSAPDFWVWVYFLFTVSNTMMPDPKTLRGWWPVVIAIGVLSVVLFVIGVGDEVLLTTMRGPVSNALNLLAGTFAVIIGIDVLVVAVLGTIEAIFERITGDSATFKDGKLIAMRRSELEALRAKQEAARAKQLAKRATAPAGPPTIYALQLPIPGGPDKEPLTVAAEVVVEREERPPLTAGAAASSRAGASLIPGTVTEKATATTGAPPGRPALQPPARDVEDKEAEETPGQRGPFAPATPRGLTPPRPALKPPSEDDEEEDEERAAPRQQSPFGGTASRGFTPSRPGMKPSDEDEEEEQDEEQERPKTGAPGQRSPFGTPPSRGFTPSRPGIRPADKDEEEDDDYEDEAEEDEAL